MEDRARKSALRDFLMECRARLQPQDVGLVSIGRRRVPGLRREEVAQLADISAAWYTLLETARDIRVSPRMLGRVAAALRLNEEERVYLFSLAIDELPTVPRATPESAGSIGREYFQLTNFARRSRAASTVAELGSLTTGVLFDLMQPAQVAYFVEADLATETFAFAAQRTAPGVAPVPGKRFSMSSVHDGEEVLVKGGLFAEHNLPQSRHAIFRERARAQGSGRFMSAGVKGPGFDGALGYFEPACEPHSDRERHLLGLLAEIVHLALAARN